MPFRRTVNPCRDLGASSVGGEVLWAVVEATVAVAEAVLLAVALDGRVSDGELRDVRARARKLWPLAPLHAWMERATVAIAHDRSDDDATAAFLAIGAPLKDRRIPHEAVAARARGRPNVADLCGRAPGYSDAAVVERLAARSRPP